MFNLQSHSFGTDCCTAEWGRFWELRRPPHCGSLPGWFLPERLWRCAHARHRLHFQRWGTDSEEGQLSPQHLCLHCCCCFWTCLLLCKWTCLPVAIPYQVLQEALTVIGLLDVLCEMTSDLGEFMFLQEYPNLLETTVSKWRHSGVGTRILLLIW